jgi:hypothetical protein
MSKKLVFTTNAPSASTDYAAADGTWKTMSGGGGGVPYTGATADVDLGTYSLTADSIGIGTTAGAEKLHIDGGASTTRVKIDADNGVSRILSFRTDDLQRWALRVDGIESGSNSGADFQVRRYNDAGAHIDNPIAINRATGNITTAQNINGASATEMSYLNGVTSSIQSQLNSKVSTSQSQFFVAGSATGLGAGATRYGNVAGSTAESQLRLPVSAACTISHLYVRTTATMNASASLKVSVFKNGTITAVTLTIAGGSAAGTYSDTSNSVTFAAGDGWVLGYTNAGSATAAASSGQSVKITI